MRLGALSGDAMQMCGPSPCGLLDAIWPSAECDAWQVCAASQNAGVSVANDVCVVGGIDANGDTIINCPSPLPPAPGCLMGSGPLQPGQSYCSDPFSQQAQTPGVFSTSTPAGSSMALPLIIGGGLLLLMIASKR